MKTPLRKAKEKLMKIVKNRVYTRDFDTCQWCGLMVSGSNRQASHVIAVSQGNALAFDETNLKVLCYHCHQIWHKSPLDAMVWFKAKFPERYEYLMEHRQDEVHWKLHDYERMIEELS